MRVACSLLARRLRLTASPHFPTPRQNRFFSQMTYRQCLQAHSSILAALSTSDHIQALQNLRALPADDISKWQAVVGMLMPVQIQALSLLQDEDGSEVYTADHQGLMMFNQHTAMFQKQEKTGQLSKASNDRWLYLLQVGFGLSEARINQAPALALPEARQMAIQISEAMQAESFLCRLDKRIAALGVKDTDVTRRQEVLLELLPLQESIIAHYGYSGPGAYVLAQRALMAHVEDIIMVQAISRGMQAVFERTGLQ